MSLVGRTIGRYRITEKLGEGGMGVVYRAQDSTLGRDVAIKVLRPEIGRQPERVRRFSQEARAASALNHPNIVTVHDAGEFEDGPFLVMELVEGESLRASLRRGSLPLAKVLDIGIQAATALTRAHEAGITHRDLKPENILVRPDGYVKILDFGLAKLKEKEQPAEGASDATTIDAGFTSEGSILGTAAYMSPEQATGRRVDGRSDIFSLGLLLFECWQGRHPFLRENVLDTLHAIAHERPPALAYPAGSPEWGLARILEKAVEKERDERYQTMKDLGIDLRRLRQESESGKLPSSAAAPARPTRRPLLYGVAGMAAVLAIFVAGHFYFHRTPKLTDKDKLVLADFINTTGDPVFDGTLRQGLAIQLEQSPFLSLVSEERIQQALRLMGRPADAPLTPELAREICERTAGAAVLDGSIASLGSQYVLGLRARNCRTGDVLDEEQAQAARKEDVLNALSQIASKFRTRVGESLTTVEKHETPLAEATTPSLEALKAYSAALKVAHSTGFAAAVRLLKRAVEIDPEFAMAYASLGLWYSGMGESVLSTESTSTAYQLRDRASDREKFFITANYDRQVTGNLEKGQQTCELWAQTYPRDRDAHGLLSGFISQGSGKYEKSIEEAKLAIGLDPDFTVAYVNIAYSYFYLDRLGEAENAIQRASELKLEMPEFLVLRYYISFLKGDRVGMEREVALSQGKSGAEDWIAHSEALVSAYSGRLQQANRRSRRAVDLARQASQRERAATFEAGPAVWNAFFGNTSEARQRAMAALELSKGRDVEYGAAFALALAGDSGRAQSLVDDLERRFPEDTSVRFNYLPTLRARLALNHSEPSKAIELLQSNVPYELAVPAIDFNAFFGGLYPVYVRGEAYLAAHQGVEAATEFQKLLNHRGIVAGDPIGALAHLQLGRAFALSGDKTKAKTAYQDFLTLWKDADPDIPILKEAKAEYAKLQ